MAIAFVVRLSCRDLVNRGTEASNRYFRSASLVQHLGTPSSMSHANPGTRFEAPSGHDVMSSLTVESD